MASPLKPALEQLETFVADVIYDRRKGLAASFCGCFLSGFSLLFEAIVRTRLFLYQKRVLLDGRLGCLVVVVGNLTVGGTGKTPVVEKFARTLSQRGRKVAILSRGYGSRKEPGYRKFWRWLNNQPPPPPRIVSDGETVFLTAEQAGDEPVMLARNLPGVAVLVDRNRVKAGEFAIRKYKADVLLLDDGFQYLPLRGQLNLVMVDKNSPFGNRRLLPRGILREPVDHLRRASYVFLTKSSGRPDPALEAEIRQHNPHAEIIECTHQPKYVQGVFSAERHPLESLKDVRVAAFSGIAVPESFEAFLSRYGCDIVFRKRFLDHHRFSQSEVTQLFRSASQAGAQWVLTTEKDAVRIPPEWQSQPLPFYFLRLEVEILSGATDFEEAVARICKVR